VDIHCFNVARVRPYVFNNCTVGNADAAGSIFIERRFEDAVRKRLGQHAEDVLRPRWLSEMIRNFRDFIVPEFEDSDPVDSIPFAVPGAPNIPEAGVEDGFMLMTR
jgi:hypothetical protein